jgi:hypothetical protein
LPRFLGKIDALIFMLKSPGGDEFKLDKKLYKSDKPRSCRYCYFWSGKSKGCSLGVDNCYYLQSAPLPLEKTGCEDCPYGRDYPCIGWCTKAILKK